MSFLNLPAAHAVQGPPLGPSNCRSHAHLFSAVERFDVNEFGGHVLHKAVLMSFLNLPAAHAVQGPPLDPSNCLSSDVDALPDTVCGGHATQPALPVAFL